VRGRLEEAVLGGEIVELLLLAVLVMVLLLLLLRLAIWEGGDTKSECRAVPSGVTSGGGPA